MNLILLPRFRPRIIEVIALLIGHFDVCFLDAAQHFVIQLLLQSLRRFHHGISVGVLGLQISFHLGILLVAQPIVVIHHRAAIDLRGLRSFLRHWRRRERRGSVIRRRCVCGGEDQRSENQRSDSNVPQIEFFHRISFMRLENWPILYQLPVITKVDKRTDLLAADVLHAGRTFRRLSRQPVNRHKISRPRSRRRRLQNQPAYNVFRCFLGPVRSRAPFSLSSYSS